jgi:AraC-like DNA-binding protein
VRRSTLDAQRVRPIRIVQRGEVHIAGVRFHLGGLAPFARVSLFEVTDTTPSPAAVLGPEARALADTLRALPDLDDRARALDAFFLRALSPSPGQQRFADALAHLVETRGGATVNELAARGEVSPRQVHRLFAQHLGVAPKAVAGVLRFQSALRALMRDPGCTLAALAADHGYYDQAHFVREFKRFSGGLPKAHRGYFPEAMPTDFAPNMVSFVQDPIPRVSLSVRPARSAQGATTMTTHWSGSGTKDDPWRLKTPPLSADYTLCRDDAASPPVLVCQVGTTTLKYLAPRNNRMRAKP